MSNPLSLPNPDSRGHQLIEHKDAEEQRSSAPPMPTHPQDGDADFLRGVVVDILKTVKINGAEPLINGREIRFEVPTQLPASATFALQQTPFPPQTPLREPLPGPFELMPAPGVIPPPAPVPDPSYAVVNEDRNIAAAEFAKAASITIPSVTGTVVSPSPEIPGVASESAQRASEAVAGASLGGMAHELVKVPPWDGATMRPEHANQTNTGIILNFNNERHVVYLAAVGGRVANDQDEAAALFGVPPKPKVPSAEGTPWVLMMDSAGYMYWAETKEC
jgi:hypothetical protein